MTDLVFYKSTVSSPEKVITSIIEKSIFLKKRSLVLVDNEEECKKWDLFMWTYSKLSFIPHSSSVSNFIISEQNYIKQKVYITSEFFNKNNAAMIFNLTKKNEILKFFDNVERFIEIVPFENDLMSYAESRVSFYKNYESIKTFLWEQKDVSWVQKFFDIEKAA